MACEQEAAALKKAQDRVDKAQQLLSNQINHVPNPPVGALNQLYKELSSSYLALDTARKKYLLCRMNNIMVTLPD